MTPDQKTRRHRFRFSLRTLIWIVTGTAVVIGLALFGYRTYFEQNLATEELRSLGGYVVTATAEPNWIESKLGLRRVKVLGVGFIFQRLGDEHAHLLTRLPDLRSLVLIEADISDRSLDFLANSEHLEELRIDNVQISDRGIAKLQGLIGLTSLDLNHTGVGEASLGYICTLPLKHLGMIETRVTDTGMPKIGRIGTLEELWLDRTLITGAGLASIARLNKLKRIWLDFSPSIVGGIRSVPKETQLGMYRDKLSRENESTMQDFDKIGRGGHIGDTSVLTSSGKEYRGSQITTSSLSRETYGYRPIR